MLGTSESYFGALAVELGLRDLSLSILATLPLALGALAQFASPAFVRILGGEKRWVVTGAALQATTQLAFCAIAWTESRSFALLLAAQSLYWMAGSAIAPAWNAWMSRLVPADLRGRYFARRFWIVNVALLGSFLGAGLLLEGFRELEEVLAGFTLLFALAFSARMTGAFVMSRKVRCEPSAAPHAARLRTVFRHGRFRIAIFMAALLFGAQFAVPFFTPYMLKTLGLGFAEFAFLTSLSILAKAIAFPLWRRAADAFRPVAVLAVSGALIALVPAVWFFFTSVEALACAQMLGGIAWAGYELTSLELLMGDAPEDARVEFYSVASSLAAIMQVGGALLGGIALHAELLDYRYVFLVSACGRALALVVLLPLVGADARVVRILTRAVSVRPNAGVVRDPVVVNEDEERRE
jgi:MFS family permease